MSLTDMAFSLFLIIKRFEKKFLSKRPKLFVLPKAQIAS